MPCSGAAFGAPARRDMEAARAAPQQRRKRPGPVPSPGAAPPLSARPLPPPGLEAPPGLERALSPPPGLGKPPGLQNGPAKPAKPAKAAKEAKPEAEPEEEAMKSAPFVVTIRGLPNKLLSNAMMEAMLQQADLDKDVLSSVVRMGKPCGELRVGLTSRLSAGRCVRHFTGCQWDDSGIPVTAEVVATGQSVPQRVSMNAASSLSAQAAVFEPPSPCTMLTALAEESSGSPASHFDSPKALSPEAPAFLPSYFGTSNRFSIEAPVFVPAKARASERVERSERAVWAPGLVGVNSDTSTEVGESEAEDDKGNPHVPASAWPQAGSSA